MTFSSIGCLLCPSPAEYIAFENVTGNAYTFTDLGVRRGTASSTLYISDTANHKTSITVTDSNNDPPFIN
jgi:hypothetical protein